MVKENQDLSREKNLQIIANTRFKVKDISDVFEKHEPLEYIVDKVIEKASITVLYGEPGSKKTWTALDIATCVALGKNWLDYPCQQKNVLFIDEESGIRRIRKRIYESLRGHGIDNSANILMQYISSDGLNLSNEDDVDELSALIEETNTELVIIDSLTAVSGDVDENSVRDMKRIFLNLKNIINNTGTSFLVIHHKGKSSNGYRGSSVIKQLCNIMLELTSKDDSNYIKFKSDKVQEDKPIKFAAIANFDDEKFYMSATIATSSKSLMATKVQQYILEYLLENGISALSDLKNSQSEFPTGTVKTAYYELNKLGYVERTDAGGKGTKAFLTITDKGKDFLTKIDN